MNLTDINEIRALLSRNGFRFSKSLGQNFLIDASVPRAIAEASGADETTGVVEIGPGVGCLTEQLAQRAAKVVSIELDGDLKPVLAETLKDYNNVEVIFGDALKTDLKALVAEKFPGLRPVVCANLPYNVTTPVLTALLESGCFESITVMIQREVAHRICAKAGTAEYGAFGVFVTWYCTTELLFDVPPSCFIPQPKVTSSVIRLTRRAEPPVQVQDEKLMFRVIRAAFNQRRKTLSNALSSGFGELSKDQIAQAIEACGFDPRIRGEVLDLAHFAQLSDEIGKIIATNL